MYKPKSVRENETHKILWGFEIQMNHLIQARKPNLVSINKKKKNSLSTGFSIPVDHRGKIKQNKNINKYMDLARELKKNAEH